MISVFTMPSDAARSYAQPNVTTVLHTIRSADTAIHQEKCNLCFCSTSSVVQPKNSNILSCETSVCAKFVSKNKLSSKEMSANQA